MIYNMAMFRKIFSLLTSYEVITFCIGCNISFSLHFEAIVKIGQYKKSNLMIYNLNIFGKIFVVTVNYDNMGI